jgi:cbb3-type cytochrome oxidase subunit 3
MISETESHADIHYAHYWWLILLLAFLLLLLSPGPAHG